MNSKKPFCQKMVDFTANDLSGCDPVGKLESYYNESKNSYTVTLSPSFGFLMDPVEDVYSIKDGEPFND